MFFKCVEQVSAKRCQLMSQEIKAFPFLYNFCTLLQSIVHGFSCHWPITGVSTSNLILLSAIGLGFDRNKHTATNNTMRLGIIIHSTELWAENISISMLFGPQSFRPTKDFETDNFFFFWSFSARPFYPNFHTVRRRSFHKQFLQAVRHLNPLSNMFFHW